MKFIFEAYEGIANITTIDSKTGLILLTIAPGCLDDVKSILNALKKDIMIEPVPEGENR